jgi:hypothetical protein
VNATVRLDTKNPISECNRGDAFRVKGEYGRAITDFGGGDPAQSQNR